MYQADPKKRGRFGAIAKASGMLKFISVFKFCDRFLGQLIQGVILQNPGIQKYVEFKDAAVLPIIFGRVSRTKYPTLGVLVYARAFLREQYGESAAHLVIG